MKKLLLLASVLWGASNLSAQTIFSHDFENGNIAPMTIKNVDGLTPASNVSFVTDAWVNYTLTNGNKVAMSTSWYSPAGVADDWIITPALAIDSVTTVLRWKAVSLNANFLDGYEVKVSTTNDSLQNFTTNLFTTPGESAGNFVSRSTSLAAYNGDTIYIAFRNNSNDKVLLAIDDIFVGTPQGNDLAISGLSGLGSPEQVGSKTFDIEFFNEGADTITAFNYTVDVDGTIFPGVVTGASIAPYSSFTATTPTITFTESNSLPISVRIDSIPTKTDMDLTNDTLSFNIKVFPSIPNFTLNDSYGNSHDLYTDLQAGKVVVLDFFASWCGPCQTSTPALNTFYENWGAGNDLVQVYGMTVEDTDDNAVVNGLGWGATYPKFAYNETNEDFYRHFALNKGLNTGGSIPFFVMICPDTGDVKNSTIIESDAGFSTGMFTNSYSPKVQTCQPNAQSYVSVEEISKESIEAINIYPNPTNTGEANLAIELSSSSNVKIAVYNTAGKMVLNTVRSNVNGQQNITLNTSAFEAGIYTVQLIVNDKVYAKKLSVVK